MFAKSDLDHKPHETKKKVVINIGIKFFCQGKLLLNHIPLNTCLKKKGLKQTVYLKNHFLEQDKLDNFAKIVITTIRTVKYQDLKC